MRCYILLGFHFLHFFASVACDQHLTHQRHERWIDADNISSVYDYIVVGGGQSGLVVANRLSESNEATVLVVEYGHFDNRPEQVDPSSATIYAPQNLYNLTSAPQVGLLGYTKRVLSACAVGGGSTVNGMMLNRGAADDYDNWAKLNGDPQWSFEGLLPYFKKSTAFQEPHRELVHDFNITWSSAAYGHDSPIHVSICSFQYPGLLPQWQGMQDLGLPSQLEGANGRAYGVFWYPNAIDNKTVTRSYAVSGYYTPVANRTNLHILTGHRVNEILFDKELKAYGVRIQARGASDNESIITTNARKEIVLAAGALHSPQVLQRSGIGPAALLQKAGINVLVDLPGVGSNLQDHPTSRVTFNYTQNFVPNPQYMNSNKTFIDWAHEVWAQNRTGPLARTTGNTVSLIPLPKLSPDRWASILTILQRQNSSEFLPLTYTEEQLAGFEAQKLLLIDSFRRSDNAAIEVPFDGGSSFSTVMTKSLSRGTVLLNPNDIYSEPTLDFGTFTNPLDAYIMVESYHFIRRWHATSILVKSFRPTEIQPGADIKGHDELELIARNTTTPTIGHLSGTCALAPRRLGGVVGTDLRVYGTIGLSVIDASIMPIIPGTHLCATVYAIAEKAADLIKARHDGTYAKLQTK